MPETPSSSSGKKPEIAQLDEIFAPPDAENFTEATIKYEALGTRQARKTKEAATAAQERLFTLKSHASEEQKQYAMTLLTSIASGTTGYAFGKKQDKPEKE